MIKGQGPGIPRAYFRWYSGHSVALGRSGRRQELGWSKLQVSQRNSEAVCIIDNLSTLKIHHDTVEFQGKSTSYGYLENSVDNAEISR